MNKKELTKLVSFMTMGDGCLWARKDTHNAQFIMNMVKDNEDYIDYCVSVLENITSVRKYDVPKKGQIRIETCRHPFFTKIKNRIYVDKYKSVDPHALKMLDAESLAILYMCDGSLYTDKRHTNLHYSITLNMKRLSYGDQFILKKSLKELLGLEWNINRHGKYYYLRLRSKDNMKFMEMIRPYMCQSFSYKLIPTNSPS